MRKKRQIALSITIGLLHDEYDESCSVRFSSRQIPTSVAPFHARASYRDIADACRDRDATSELASTEKTLYKHGVLRRRAVNHARNYTFETI